MTPITVRRLSQADLPAAVPLLLASAEARSRLEPLLWPLHPDAAERTRAALERDLTHPEVMAWFLAERDGKPVGIVKGGRDPAPPVYADLLAGQTGDDLYATDPATMGNVLTPLLDASEAFQAGADVHTAVCAAQDGAKLAFLRGRGYQPITNWMIRAVDTSAALPSSVRPATPGDIPAIVKLNAAAQEQKKQANPRFWTPHPQARERFAGWMHRSLTLPDRDMLVSEKNGQVQGFVIVQPTPHLAPAHDASLSATVDDFAAADWDTFHDLLRAAQHTAAGQGKTTLQVISPIRWPERNEALTGAGFRTANYWLLRD